MDIGQILQNATMPVIVTALFLWYMNHSEAQRVENAKAAEKERREHQAAINRLWATTLKDISDNVRESSVRMIESNERIIEALTQHELASQERYRRQGTTQDLVDAVKELKKQL